MSLLDDASLIVTPNGYKASKLYSVKPTDASGDMVVSRGTSATRVDSAGLIEIARTNLLLRSEEFDNASWEKNVVGINTSIGTNGIESNVANAPSGTLIADRVNFTLQSDLDVGLKQVYASAVATQSFVSSIYVKGEGSNIGKQIKLRIKRSVGGSFASVDTTITLTSDWVRITSSALTLLASNTGVQYIISSNDATNALIWGAQLEQGSNATSYIPTIASIRTKFAGITQDGSVAQNIPRLDYTNSSCPSILLEPARTNLVLQSQDLSNSSWTKTNTTITANSITSPIASFNSDSIVENSASNVVFGVHANARPSGLTLGTTYSVSFFAKKITRDFCYYDDYNGFQNPIVQVFFNLSTGLVGTSTLGVLNPKMENYGNGWYRCSFQFVATGVNGDKIDYRIASATTDNTLTYSGTIGQQSISVTSCQFEAGSNATSYIPTTTSTVTRNGDQISRANLFTNGIVTASGGTWFMEIRNNLVYTRDNSNVNINLDDSSGFNNGFLLRNTGTGRLSIQKTILGSATFLYLTTTDLTKIAIKWNGVTADVFANGVKVVSATAFTTTNLQTILTQMQVPVFINLMALFPTPLTDTQCTQLTTP